VGQSKKRFGAGQGISIARRLGCILQPPEQTGKLGITVRTSSNAVQGAEQNNGQVNPAGSGGR